MRYERKYKIENLSLPLVEQSVRLHPASFKKIFPDRQINNIYFDTADFRTYKDNVCLLYTSPSPRDATLSRMPSSA